MCKQIHDPFDFDLPIVSCMSFAGLGDESFRLWSSEQPFMSHDQFPHTQSTASAATGDGSPELPGAHVHGATKSTKTTHKIGRENGVVGVGRSSSEEMMRTHSNVKGGEYFLQGRIKRGCIRGC